MHICGPAVSYGSHEIDERCNETASVDCKSPPYEALRQRCLTVLRWRSDCKVHVHLPGL